MEESLSLGVNLDRVYLNYFRWSGIHFFNALFAAKQSNWLGQSAVAVLKCITNEISSHHEMISAPIKKFVSCGIPF